LVSKNVAFQKCKSKDECPVPHLAYLPLKKKNGKV